MPDDGAVGMELWERGTLIGRLDDPALGHDLRYDARLEPGDYQVWLRPITPSEGDYRLDVERADPFTTDADLEPNDTVLAARPMPASLAVDGTGRAPRGEDDWFALPPLVADGTVSAEAEGDVALLGLSDGQTELRLTPDPVTGLPTSPPSRWHRRGSSASRPRGRIASACPVSRSRPPSSPRTCPSTSR